MLVSFLMTDSVLQCDTHLYILNQKMQLSLLILNMTSSTRIRSSPTQKTCHNCGDFAHLIKDCKEKRRPPPRRPPPQPIRSNTFQQRSWDFNPNPKSYASITKGNLPLRSSVDDSMHNPRNLSTAPLHHFNKNILDTFKIITNEITNINNSFIDMKKEFSAFKSQLTYMDQRLQRLEQIADHPTTSPPPPPVTPATHTPELQLQADKIESSIQDTNNRLSSIYASISMLAKNFGASSSEQRQLQFPSYLASSDTTNLSSSPPHPPNDDVDMFVDAKSSFSNKSPKISTNLSFPKSS